MGLFSTKKKKKFVTAVQRMIEDDKVILSSKAAVTNYIFSSNMSVSIMGKSLPDYLIEASLNALPAKYRNAYRYAKSGKYAYGLPKSAISSAEVDITPQVKTYLETNLSKPINFLYCQLDEANYLHFFWKILIEKYGYSAFTNEITELSTSVGFPCFLKSAQINYAQATIDNILDLSYLDQWGVSTEFGHCFERSQALDTPQVSYVIDPSTVDDYVKITYEYDEYIPDTTPPVGARIQSYDGSTLKGVAEKTSTITVLDSLGETIKEVLVDEFGRFEITIDNPQPPESDPPEDPIPEFIYAYPELDIRVTDSVGLSSDLVHVVKDYINPDTLEEGENPTQTIFRRTGEFTFNFLKYFDTNDESSDVASKDTLYVMASYTYEDAGQIYVDFFTYAYRSGTIPELDILPSFTDSIGDFYPRLYARLDGNNLSKDTYKNTPEYASSKRMAKLLGIDWKSWCETLHENIDDVGSVQQLFMTLAAPLNTDDSSVAEYLFRYFTRLYNNSDSPILTASEIGNKNLAGVTESMNIKKGLAQEVRDNVYTHITAYNYISKFEVVGSIGKVNTFTSKFIKNSGSAYHAIRWQKDINTYIEIRLYGATSKHLFSSGSTTVSGEDEALVVPLDRSVIPQMTSNELEILFSKSLHLFINVMKVIKVKWYQRGAFKVVMAVVAIVISVATVGAGAPFAAYAYAALYAVAVSIAVSVAIQVLSKVLVKLGIGGDVALAIAAIVAVVAIIAGNTDGLKLLLDTSANSLLQITNAAFQIATNISNYELQQVMKNMDEFEKYAKSQWQLLDEAKKLLEVGVPLDFEILMGDLRSKVLINLGESPDAFLTRNIGLGNVGTLCFDMVSGYVDSKLVLPDLNSTMKMTEQRGN